MCGIVGYTGREQAEPILLKGLQSLEYRGYDSAGMAVIDRAGALHLMKRKGKVQMLADALAEHPLDGTCGIAHTRWATHGVPSERNAHPFADCTGTISLLHNGIIENYAELRAELVAAGHTFTSETDSEVVVHLVESLYDGDLAAALRAACQRLDGAWALVAVSAREPGVIVAARKGSPLVVASTPKGALAASDLTALAPYTRDVVALEDNEFAVLRADGSVEVTDAQGQRVDVETLHIDWDVSSATLGGYPDFMMKEISEQPQALERLLHDRVRSGRVELDELDLTDDELRAIDRIYVVACGTSYHAGLVAKALIESWARVPVEVDVASELMYRDALVTPHTLCLVITQSGETAETLLCARRLKDMGARLLAVTNVLGSTAARDADGVLYLQSGPEVSVASTKAYTSMLVAMVLIALFLASKRGRMDAGEVAEHLATLERLPAVVRTALDRQGLAAEAATAFEGAHSALFLGRGLNSASAREGALKLKEVSYLHAEAYPAGEMKHGPIALIDLGFPVVVVVPRDALRAKTVSNIAEIKARGAVVIAVATQGDDEVAALADHVLWLPPLPDWCTPVVVAVYLQLMARDVALDRGCDVDRPRNLAKSVTTE
ncbi:MAG: glutamine--fructose-6-phosphate transaminase (isomerizing) [Coriobacteriia bacterium]|nr:glutamine--fructose-6-phosphate transaminase (isomerizing) [Coriobacteriia bacterium]